MKKTIAILLMTGVAVVALVVYLTLTINRPGSSNLNLDSFAQCLGQKGAVMYGAFWCSHCQNQKQMFSSSVKYLPYVECSSTDGKSQLQVCAANNITGYPTWVFSDSARYSGEMTLQELSLRTGCPLPG